MTFVSQKAVRQNLIFDHGIYIHVYEIMNEIKVFAITVYD